MKLRRVLIRRRPSPRPPAAGETTGEPTGEPTRSPAGSPPGNRRSGCHRSDPHNTRPRAASDEGGPFHPVRRPGGPRDRGAPRSASGSRSGPDRGARGGRERERLEEAPGPDGSRSSRRPWATRRRVSSTSSARASRTWPSAIGCSASVRGRGPGRAGGVVLLRADPAVARLPRRGRAAGRGRDGHARARPARRRERQHAARQRRLRKRRQRRGPARRGARCARDRHRRSGEPRAISARWGPSPSPTARASSSGFARSRPTASTPRSTSPGAASCPSSSSSRAARSTS